MLKNDRERKICAKYSAKDKDGFVHCDKCPLMISAYDLMCRATAHYDKHEKAWEFDEEFSGGACDEDD